MPPTGAILRINASGPTGVSTEIRNMGLQWGDYIDLAAFHCKLKSQRDLALDAKYGGSVNKIRTKIRVLFVFFLNH